jgi:hypothetical protein
MVRWTSSSPVVGGAVQLDLPKLSVRVAECGSDGGFALAGLSISRTLTSSVILRKLHWFMFEVGALPKGAEALADDIPS